MKKKPSVAIADFASRRRSIGHHPRARLLDVFETAQCVNAARLAANVRCADAEHFDGGPIEASDRAVERDDDNRNLDRVQDADDIGAARVRGGDVLQRDSL
jgi:hypothetical protein